MDYEELWKALSDLLAELRRTGEAIPTETLEDLRSAKTMIQVLKADPARTENISRIEAYLEKVESYLIFTAQNKFGPEFAERWMRKIEGARKGNHEEKLIKVPSRFVPGLPKSKRWVRVQVSEDTPKEYIEKLAQENGLSCRMQENGYMLVYGEDGKIKSLVKKMTKRFRGAKSNNKTRE
jgi:hypothetical protein